VDLERLRSSMTSRACSRRDANCWRRKREHRPYLRRSRSGSSTAKKTKPSRPRAAAQWRRNSRSLRPPVKYTEVPGEGHGIGGKISKTPKSTNGSSRRCGNDYPTELTAACDVQTCLLVDAA
jgi:hypothetical protein